MIKIIIGNCEKEFKNIDNQWIIEQISKRHRDGIEPCIKVIIKKDDLDMILSTPNCEIPKVNTRRPRQHEDEIFKLWNKIGLNSNEFRAINLIDFLKQLRYVI